MGRKGSRRVERESGDRKVGGEVKDGKVMRGMKKRGINRWSQMEVQKKKVEKMCGRRWKLKIVM